MCDLFLHVVQALIPGPEMMKETSIFESAIRQNLCLPQRLLAQFMAWMVRFGIFKAEQKFRDGNMRSRFVFTAGQETIALHNEVGPVVPIPKWLNKKCKTLARFLAINPFDPKARIEDPDVADKPHAMSRLRFQTPDVDLQCWKRGLAEPVHWSNIPTMVSIFAWLVLSQVERSKAAEARAKKRSSEQGGGGNPDSGGEEDEDSTGKMEADEVDFGSFL